ncbi:MAG: type I 3-dehydroquinate dehydratase [Clostridia bacterium]|nr:type I 3-dehydroquinate dehydratase [Clostridia bacterium]
MKSFLGYNRPVITTMLKSTTIKDVIIDIESALKEGTDAFCLQLEKFDPLEKNEANLKEVFATMGDKPCYITNYRRDNFNKNVPSDEELTEEMLFALSCGATLFDVRSDLFDPRPDENEITFNENAVRKQIELIKEVHRLGGEVIMSAHTFRFNPYNEILEIAKAQEERGADIVKIVTSAETEEELQAHFEATLNLNKDINKPTLFLCNGSYSRKHRLLGPVLSSSLYLSVQQGKPCGFQPTMADAKQILKTIGYDL